ncbi:MAG: hypothetical protein WBA22_12615 [Candidatus Methanofastidiosia archaeon]|jgi:hypothetical protein
MNQCFVTFEKPFVAPLGQVVPESWGLAVCCGKTDSWGLLVCCAH